MSVEPQNSKSAAPDVARPGGIQSMVLAALYFSVMSLLVKLAGSAIPTQQIVLIRGLFGIGFAYWLVRRAGVPLWGQRKALLWVRGALGFGAMSCFYYGLIHLPLAEATVIQYTNPVWTLYLAAIFLGEKLSLRMLLLGGASIAGVILIARPEFLFGGAVTSLDPLVVTIALSGAVLSAGAYVTVRKLAATEATVVIVFYFTLATVIGSAPWLLLEAVWPTPYEWLLLAGIGFTALVAQLYLTRGLSREPAGRATFVGYLQILFAATWGAIFFAERPDAWSVAGALLILGSVLAVAGRWRLGRSRVARVEEHTAEI
jgi:drug/metabolite transporter (DMT)-like permease